MPWGPAATVLPLAATAESNGATVASRPAAPAPRSRLLDGPVETFSVVFCPSHMVVLHPGVIACWGFERRGPTHTPHELIGLRRGEPLGDQRVGVFCYRPTSRIEESLMDPVSMPWIW